MTTFITGSARGLEYARGARHLHGAGIIGVVSAFGLFYLAERVFHSTRTCTDHDVSELSVAGHLTIFLTRTRGPFWSIRPATILWIAVLGTQILATLFASTAF